MSAVLRAKYIDFLIFILLIPVLIVDMMNGILSESNVDIPLSVSQFYKMGIVFLCSVRLLKNMEFLKMLLIILTILLLGSLHNFMIGRISIAFVFQDIIKTSKYLIVLISFLYFQIVFSRSRINMMPYYMVWIKVSYFILAFNLLTKLVGMGYPMYDNGGIGTKGFFMAGNEISALLVILSGIMGFYYWQVKEDKIKFWMYAILSFIMGLLISSKTGMLGIILINFLIVFDPKKIDVKSKKHIQKLIYTFSALGLGATLLVIFILNSPIMYRYTYFWDRLDLWTFIFSSRNLYFQEVFQLYKGEYSLVDKIIGVGNSLYETMTGKIIEIDILDIFFIYGYFGAIFFLLFIISLFFYAMRLKNKIDHPFARLSFIMISILSVLSCLSGHIFNSGIAGIYIGFVFAMMFFSTSAWKRERE